MGLAAVRFADTLEERTPDRDAIVSVLLEPASCPVGLGAGWGERDTDRERCCAIDCEITLHFCMWILILILILN